MAQEDTTREEMERQGELTEALEEKVATAAPSAQEVDLSKIIRMAESKVEKQIRLPNSQAFKMCWRNVTIRLGRSAITASGIFLGIAFFASVMTQSAILDATKEKAREQGKVADDLGPVTGTDELEARKWWLVVMALLVSVVGIANSMLMSVTERFREIGTMKCLGALDRFIVKIFLFESALLGFLGSSLGAILGILSMWLVGVIKYDFNLGDVWTQFIFIFLAGSFLGMILSIIAAIAPARQAAQMPAAAALRVEI